MIGEFGPWHLLIIAGVIVLMTGGKRLPEAARSIGQSLKIFKNETKTDNPPPAIAPAPSNEN